MAGNATDVRLGAAWVTFGSTDLGYTKGGITFSLETTQREITVDQEGTSPISAVILGRRCTVDCPLAESSYSRLQALMPDSTYVDGLFQISSGLGDNLLSFAQTLTITSKQNANDWIKVYKAVPVASLRATFSPDGERIWPVQFIGFIGSTTDTYPDVLCGLNYAS
jgi:hypothetical protein